MPKTKNAVEEREARQERFQAMVQAEIARLKANPPEDVYRIVQEPFEKTFYILEYNPGPSGLYYNEVDELKVGEAISHWRRLQHKPGLVNTSFDTLEAAEDFVSRITNPREHIWGFNHQGKPCALSEY